MTGWYKYSITECTFLNTYCAKLDAKKIFYQEWSISKIQYFKPCVLYEWHHCRHDRNVRGNFIITWDKIRAICWMCECFEFQCCQHQPCQLHCMGSRIVMQQHDLILALNLLFHQFLMFMCNSMRMSTLFLYLWASIRSVWAQKHQKRASTSLFPSMFLTLLSLCVAIFVLPCQ